jgi:cobalt-zinc-cadmium efflux system outer membrane protein
MRSLAFVFVTALLGPPALAQTAPPSQPVASAQPITLDELEQLALQNNPTTTAAAAGIEAARGRARQAGAWPNPVIGYSGEEIKTDVGDRRGEHGFFVEQAIPLGGKLRLSRNILQRTLDRAEAVRDLQRLRILSSVRQAFYSVLLTERRIEVQERLAALASEAVGVTAQLFNVGAADRPDFLEIEIESRRLQLQVNRSRNELVAVRAQLAAVTGVREVTVRPIAGSADTAIPELEREEVVRVLLEQSPELRAARAELERTRAVTTRARRDAYPDLFLRAGSAYNRERGEETGRPIGWEGTLEAGVSVPVFNRNAGGIAAARADESRAQAEVTRLELALQSRAASQFANYLTALRASEAYRSEILPRAEEAYRLYLSRYREMAAAYPQVLVAQRTLFELSNEYLETLNEAWRAALQLQGFLAGDGLDAPASASEGSNTPGVGSGGER